MTSVEKGGVKFIVGLLSISEDLLKQAKCILTKKYGPIDLESPVILFDFTDYYDDELGKGIKRQYISFAKHIRPEYIGKIKRQTIRIEHRFTISGNRKVNIDPGFVALDKLILATTKDGTYRIYLGKGIYAQSTLYFEKGSYKPWQWTYPDYKTETAITFFNRARAIYKSTIRA